MCFASQVGISSGTAAHAALCELSAQGALFYSDCMCDATPSGVRVGAVVVLQTQWLADAMARVISFNSTARVPHGVLDHATVADIWPLEFADPVTKTTRVLAPDATIRRTLLEMLHSFGLALQLQGVDGKLQPRSLVPSMLRTCSKPTIKWREPTDRHKVMGMTASLDAVPHNLMPQLMLRAYRHAAPGDTAVCADITFAVLKPLPFPHPSFCLRACICLDFETTAVAH